VRHFTIDNRTDPSLLDKEYLWLRPQNYIHSDLKKLTLTNERAEGVFELATKIGGEDHKLSGIYLRASLGELVSMEETLKIDQPGQTPLKLNQIENTLLHILRELRNFQFHLRNVDLSYNETELTIISENDSSFSMQGKGKLTVIDNLDIQDLKKLRNIKDYYTDSEILHMIDWMNLNQKEYSIQSLVLKGLKFYSTELVTHYRVV
jgi:hypothetical protein